MNITTISNPSFESGFTSWGNTSSGSNGTAGISSTTGVTDGSQCLFCGFNAVADRPIGNYFYLTQSISFNSDFTLRFDWYDSASSAYEMLVLIDNDVVYSSAMSGGGQNSNVDVSIQGYTGSHTLKLGVRTVSVTSAGGRTYIDNLRIISETATVFYVKTTGNDASAGTSWGTAWATIDKAATTVADGTTVHIGFGNYSQTNAQDIAPINAGSIGIKYIPETATAGGGTGEVKITLTT